MGDLDIAAKALLRVEPRAFVRLALPGRQIVSVEPDETEFSRVEMRMDKLLRVHLADETEPVWQHVEVEANWASDVPERVFDYWSLARRERGTVRSLVIVLKPSDRQAKPIGRYVVDVLGDRVVDFHFDVVCAWELDARRILSGAELALVPLVPFANGSSKQIVGEAFEVLERSRAPDRGDLAVALAVFSGHVFPGDRWLDRIGAEVGVENPVLQELFARGRRGTLERLLRIRLGKSKRTEAVIAGLPSASEEALAQVEKLLVGSKKKPALFTALERLLPAVDDEKS